VIDPPSTTGSNGRASGGRFGPGNRFARGNPHARRVAALRAALLRAVKPADLAEVAAALLASAKGGDVAATRELMQRVLGPAESIDLIDRIESLERLIAHPLVARADKRKGPGR
jgi:hypothetical protein